FTACLASFKGPDAGVARWASRSSLGLAPARNFQIAGFGVLAGRAGAHWASKC
ncbi:hypothetical protein A2U01_0075751, partial [Trifolium medium]|nr:hypothetical protein [Trifolium medium]